VRRELITHLECAEFVYRHRRQEGDLLVWDNAAVLHRAAEATSAGPRLLHRVTVRGPQGLSIGASAGA
jgi:taurine dioxygenase